MPQAAQASSPTSALMELRSSSSASIKAWRSASVRSITVTPAFSHFSRISCSVDLIYSRPQTAASCVPDGAVFLDFGKVNGIGGLESVDLAVDCLILEGAKNLAKAHADWVGPEGAEHTVLYVADNANFEVLYIGGCLDGHLVIGKLLEAVMQTGKVYNLFLRKFLLEPFPAGTVHEFFSLLITGESERYVYNLELGNGIDKNEVA